MEISMPCVLLHSAHAGPEQPRFGMDAWTPWTPCDSARRRKFTPFLPHRVHYPPSANLYHATCPPEYARPATAIPNADVPAVTFACCTIVLYCGTYCVYQASLVHYPSSQKNLGKTISSHLVARGMWALFFLFSGGEGGGPLPRPEVRTHQTTLGGPGRPWVPEARQCRENRSFIFKHFFERW